MATPDKSQKTKVIFFFPWREVSGGPFYLTRLADELALDHEYEVFYTDYANGLSDTLIKNKNVRKIEVSERDFSIRISDPVVLITPIYWACWLPKLHPDSRVLFLNWHNCCIPVLADTWRIGRKSLDRFLTLVRDTTSVFFCDSSHWMAQNTPSLVFEEKYVPISLPRKSVVAKEDLVEPGIMNLGTLGRLCDDKIHSVTNLLDNFLKIETSLKKRLYIIGDGPRKSDIDPGRYPGIEIVFTGTVTGQELDELIAEKVDVLFAMGTSILESAALRVPSVVIPHNMRPMTCDSFVYLQDSVGYCLGWYDTQIDELNLKTHSLKDVLEEIYLRSGKSRLADAAYDYYFSHHTIQSATVPLKNAIKTTSLTYSRFIAATRNFETIVKHLKFKNLSIASLTKIDPGTYQLRALVGLPVVSIHNDPEGNKKILKIFGLPVARLKGTGFFMRAFRSARRLGRVWWRRLRDPSLAEVVGHTDKRFNELDGKLSETRRQLERLSEVSNEIRKYQHPNVVQMDPCHKLVPESSFQYFMGDIREDYLDLIRGLDSESIEVVVRVLSRIQKFRNEKTNDFWFTEKERAELAEIHDRHASRILKLSDECYAYGRYLLPRKIISTTIFFYDHFVPALDDQHAIRAKEIIDVGGFIGDSAVVLAGMTSKNVHVFEPVSKLFELCERTVEMNRLSNVILNKVSLGSQAGSASIHIAGDTSTMITNELVNSDRYAQETVRIETLDDYVERHQLQIGLIKVDIEGFEQEFLKGAERTIKSQKPALLLSIYHNADDFFHIKPLIESWNLGYKFKVRKPSDHTILIDTTLIAEVR